MRLERSWYKGWLASHATIFLRTLLIVGVLLIARPRPWMCVNRAGNKRTLAGGRTGGYFHLIGEHVERGTVCIAEGLATGISIAEATGMPVAIAYCARNMRAVALAFAEREFARHYLRRR